MKFWTHQGLGVLVELRSEGVYYPKFKEIFKHKYFKEDQKKYAYGYALKRYLAINKNHISNEELHKAKGLIFGLSHFWSSKIETYEDYKFLTLNEWKNGLFSCADDEYVLELEINKPEELFLPIDFYIFSDLIFFSSDECDKDFKRVNRLKKNLLKPNCGNDYELRQYHNHCITTNMIKGIYPAVDLDIENKKLCESKCQYLKYFRQTLIK